LGMKVIAISDVTGGIINPKGIDIAAIFSHSTLATVENEERVNAGEVLEMKCNVLIPAALGGVITDSNGGKINADFIIKVRINP